mgnify:CR=1 FL=1
MYAEPPRGDVGGSFFMIRASVLIDGGFLRAQAQQARLRYTPAFIQGFAERCVTADERLLRVLYYDCPPFVGTARLPISGEQRQFSGSDAWLKDLGRRDLFALRLGALKFRGFKPRRQVIMHEPTDADFKPDFEQKGVDMRIGLDIANHAAQRSAERIVLVSGDTDCIPAMKHARINGLQVVVVSLPNHALAAELLEHADFNRPVPWPDADAA